MSTPWSRRDLMVAGLALAAGCGRRPPEALAGPPGPLVLGWRWVPGAEHSYRCEIAHVSGGRTHKRVEAWTYQVRALDRRGVATLEGRLVGLEEGVRPTRDVVELRLGMDGALEAGGCCDFDSLWPHAALGLRLPERPIEPHQTWPDPDLVRPFARLLPLEVEPRPQGRSRLVAFDVQDLTHVATLASEGRLDAEGFSIRVLGTATWDADRGALLSRSVQAWTEPASGRAGPGRLEVRLAAGLPTLAAVPA